MSKMTPIYNEPETPQIRKEEETHGNGPLTPVTKEEKVFLENLMNEVENKTHEERMKALAKGMIQLWG